LQSVPRINFERIANPFYERIRDSAIRSRCQLCHALSAETAFFVLQFQFATCNVFRSITLGYERKPFSRLCRTLPVAGALSPSPSVSLPVGCVTLFRIPVSSAFNPWLKLLHSCVFVRFVVSSFLRFPCLQCIPWLISSPSPIRGPLFSPPC
jgi:hypothetical protein